MKHLKPHLILESSNSLTKEYLDKVFIQLGIEFQFIPGRKGFQLPQFKGTIEEPKLYGRSHGYDYYLDYIDSFLKRVNNLGYEYFQYITIDDYIENFGDQDVEIVIYNK